MIFVMKHGLFVGDLDEVEFIEEVEHLFGVAFDETDYPNWLTLGDVHSSLARQIGKLESRGGGCATQIAFYRLRRAAGYGAKAARPGTPLAALDLGRPSKTMAALQHCGLRLPSMRMGWPGVFAGLALMIGGFVLAMSLVMWNGPLASWTATTMIASFAILCMTPKYYPRDVETLGKLAHATALRNPMMLKAHGAGLRPGDLWESLRAVASDHSGLPIDEIAADTPFIQQKMKRYAA